MKPWTPPEFKNRKLREKESRLEINFDTWPDCEKRTLVFNLILPVEIYREEIEENFYTTNELDRRACIVSSILIDGEEVLSQYEWKNSSEAISDEQEAILADKAKAEGMLSVEESAKLVAEAIEDEQL